MIKCLVLEDELSAQEVLRTYIDKTPFLNCLGIYESGLDVPQELLAKADLLFLDIHLPELNGLSFLKTLEAPPRVIVTSAYADYAIEAFEEAVLDYLVKPMSYERFFKGVSRVRNELSIQEKDKSTQLTVYADKTFYRIEINDILYLKAEVDYVRVVTKAQQILVLDSLRNWKEKLQNHSFEQVHRSYIVNTHEVTKVLGDQVFLVDTMIPLGRTYKRDFLNNFNKD